MAHPKMDRDQRYRARLDLANGRSVKEVADKFGVSVRTIYRLMTDPGVQQPRVLHPCGTNAAYHRHRRSGERPCVGCVEAHAAYQLAWQSGEPRPPRCGTRAASTAHNAKGEECLVCRAGDERRARAKNKRDSRIRKQRKAGK